MLFSLLVLPLASVPSPGSPCLPLCHNPGPTTCAFSIKAPTITMSSNACVEVQTQCQGFQQSHWQQEFSTLLQRDPHPLLGLSTSMQCRATSW